MRRYRPVRKITMARLKRSEDDILALEMQEQDALRLVERSAARSRPRSTSWPIRGALRCSPRWRK
jgi:hypothetical protein